jgi:hypothetical protein
MIEKIKTKKINSEQLIALLSAAKFPEIIGVEETKDIDFKEHNYDLSIEQNQYEFAKDIAAMANSGGGVICIGFSNGEDSEKLVSYAQSACPLNNAELNRRQFKQTLKNKLIPCPPSNLVSYKFFKDQDNNYYLAIQIRETPRESMPFIIPWKNNQTEYFLCPYRNESDTNSMLNINQLQSYISAGFRKKLSGQEGNELTEIKEKLDWIIEKIDFKTKEPIDKMNSIKNYLKYVKNTITSKQGFFYIAALPASPIEMNNFWDKEKNNIYNLLLNPPTLRKNGWDLRVATYYREMPHPVINRWESVNGNSKLTIIDDQGIIFSAGEIDGFFNFGVSDYKMREKIDGVVINNYALVEYIDNFAKLFIKFITDKNILDTKYDIKFGFVVPNDLKVNLLRPFNLGFYDPDIVGPNLANESEYIFNDAGKIDPKYLAGELIHIMYASLFGQTEGLAYIIKDEKGKWFVDEDKYLNK